ncbi:amino acid ABC transporter substrate-binding protein [Ensifer adhaerens]|jgi:polar amino acid transport system substrate-binding protein|uniref:amino acid ABC transporter substrate-binding protein n=1 Tax=Ensifer TaxID=106591 RepID=UPI00071567AA|nr:MULTISPECIES: amino acid ABC transporter substrate-binding protein [unclassified Ensifer]KQX45112.1 amino acid ABC transporter [Ensifer sp. Root1298]KQX76954.1 amino acid ABC transporter [Ensifer sp. Root1312]KRC26184.1 amino acid ABC transporter [Ensifer sp. Root74]KRD60244.1 amino acid ABC transporter [Ensifer sp. Root954]MBD9524785.1 amino acid ABC transporter substrate-binding protein [Ensifer sp. ENS02]
MAKRMRRFLFVSLALCFSALASAAATLNSIMESGTVRIGYISDQAPFSTRQPGAEPVGYAIDLCRKIADEIEDQIPQLKREFVEVTLADGFDAVENEDIDLLCGSITVNLKRREIVDFSQPIFLTGASALLRKDSPSYLQALFLNGPAVHAVSERVATNVIGMRANTTTAGTLREALAIQESKTKLADFNTHEDGLKALEDHRIDAYIADQVLLINLAKRARDPSSLEVGDRLITHEPYAIAMRRNDADFRLLADRALTDFYLSEDFLPLLETYFGSEAPMLHTQIIMQHVP